MTQADAGDPDPREFGPKGDLGGQGRARVLKMAEFLDRFRVSDEFVESRSPGPSMPVIHQ